MRAALLLCGQPRTMEFCYPSQKQNLLDVYCPDVFISTDDGMSRMIELYNPVSIDVRSQQDICSRAIRMRLKYNRPENEIMTKAALSISWKCYRANQLKRKYEIENGFNYDLVFISRFDVKFKKIQAVTEVKENTLYVPLIGAYHVTPPDQPGIHWLGYSTHLCWMNSYVANMLSGHTLATEKDYVKLATEALPINGNNPEHVLKYFCDDNKINVEFVNIEMMLIRGTSEKPLSFHNYPLENFPEYL
jgi:hypothetical protein